MTGPAAEVSSARFRGVRLPFWLVDSLLVVAVTRVGLLVVAYATAWFFSGESGGISESFLSIWERGDARGLLDVARDGYTEAAATRHFPLAPLLIRLISVTGLPEIAAGLLLSAIASLIAATYLHRLAALQLGESGGRRAVLYLVMFPTAVFLVAPLPDALLVAAAAAAFWHARRGQFDLAGLAAAVACATHPAGLFVLIGIAVESFTRRTSSDSAVSRVAALTAGALPLAGLALFAHQRFGDALAPLRAQPGSATLAANPLDALRLAWEGGGAYPTEFLLAQRLELAGIAALLVLLLWTLVGREWGYAAFTGTVLAWLITRAELIGTPRALLWTFPSVLLLARISAGSRRRHEILLLVCAPLATLGVVVFTRAAWFY